MYPMDIEDETDDEDQDFHEALLAGECRGRSLYIGVTRGAAGIAPNASETLHWTSSAAHRRTHISRKCCNLFITKPRYTIP